MTDNNSLLLLTTEARSAKALGHQPQWGLFFALVLGTADMQYNITEYYQYQRRVFTECSIEQGQKYH